MAEAAANIQVFGGADEAPDDLARRVAVALRELVKADGFEPVPAGEASDRELAVVIPSQRGWVTVLDEASDGQREVIETLARSLSQAVGGLTLSVVGAGKDTSMGLHGGGATLSLLPEDAREAELHGAWADLLAGGNTPQDVAALWKVPKNPVPEMAQLLCVEPSLMTVSYAALGRLGRAGARLRFRSTTATASATGPRLRAATVPGQKLSPLPGVPFRIGVVAQNKGAAAQGLELTLRGRLLTEEWLELRSVRAATGDWQDEQRPRFRVVRNDRVIQARFDGAPLLPESAGGVLSLTLECQLTRSLPTQEALRVSLEPLGSAAGGCSVDVSLGPSGK